MIAEPDRVSQPDTAAHEAAEESVPTTSEQRSPTAGPPRSRRESPTPGPPEGTAPTTGEPAAEGSGDTSPGGDAATNTESSGEVPATNAETGGDAPTTDAESSGEVPATNAETGGDAPTTNAETGGEVQAKSGGDDRVAGAHSAEPEGAPDSTAGEEASAGESAAMPSAGGGVVAGAATWKAVNSGDAPGADERDVRRLAAEAEDNGSADVQAAVDAPAESEPTLVLDPRAAANQARDNEERGERQAEPGDVADVTEVLPRYRRRPSRPHPGSAVAPGPVPSPGSTLRPGPMPGQVSGPGWAPRWPRPASQPNQLLGPGAWPGVGPLPSGAPLPQVGPPRRWPAAQAGVGAPAQPWLPAAQAGVGVPAQPGLPAAGQQGLAGLPAQAAGPLMPTAVPQIAQPPAPVVNQVISPVPATDAESTAAKKRSEKLTMSKVLAGGMAAATSAVVGSHFGGALGTVAAAAVGSVATTVATNVYQRSLERTRELAVSRVRSVTGRARDASAPADRSVGSPAEPIEEQRTVRLDAGRAVRPPVRSLYRSLVVLAGGTVLIFALGLAMVTGIEWAKGSPLSGGTSGTSVGRVLAPQPAPTSEPNVAPDDSSSRSERSSEDREDRSSTEESSRGRGPLDDLFPSSSSRSGSESPSSTEQPSRSNEGLLPGLRDRGLVQQNQ